MYQSNKLDIFKEKVKHLKEWAPTILRITLGVFFVMHGMGKIFGTAPGWEARTGMMGPPIIFAYLVA